MTNTSKIVKLVRVALLLLAIHTFVCIFHEYKSYHGHEHGHRHEHGHEHGALPFHPHQQNGQWGGQQEGRDNHGHNHDHGHGHGHNRDYDVIEIDVDVDPLSVTNQKDDVDADPHGDADADADADTDTDTSEGGTQTQTQGEEQEEEEDGGDDNDNEQSSGSGSGDARDNDNDSDNGNNDEKGESDVNVNVNVDQMKTQTQKQNITTTRTIFQPENSEQDIYLFPGTNKMMNQIQTFDDLKEQINLNNGNDMNINVNDLHLPVPRNLNILFLGDSLTRYQYLDLVYFLKYGNWVDPADEPNLLLEKQHESWIDFYNYTNGQLQPYEECDCFRDGIDNNMRFIIENRYFRDEERNNTVTYLQKFGDDFMRSSWNVSDIYTHKSSSLSSSSSSKHGPLITTRADFKPIHFFKWIQTIEEFVCKMEPKPSVFIFNEGIWANNDLVHVTLQGDIVEALRKCNVLSMFKTTTKSRGDTDRNFAKYEERLCNQTDYCLDLTWTGMVPREMYWDRVHFIPPLYSYMNLELLSLLSSIGGLVELDP